MKILLVIAMFGAVKAAPEAEADPAVLYGGHYGYGLGHYGYGLGGYYGGYYSHPTAVQAGLPYANGWTDGPNNGVGPVVHAIGKREAEAEADPAVLYSSAYGGYYGGLYGGLRGYGYGYGLGHAYGLGYGHRLGYYGHHAAAVQAGALYANGWTDGPNNGVGPVVHAIGKREAEAEADPAVLYAGAYGGYYGGLYGAYGYGYGLGHAYGLGYGHRLGYYGHHAGAVQAGALYANGWTDGPNNGVGPVVHAIGKREAEAEADPAVLYAGAYGGYYGGLYGGLRGYGYGYGLGHAYGLGYGHRLGYYGHHAGAVQAGALYANGWTDGPNNGLGPVYGK